MAELLRLEVGEYTILKVPGGPISVTRYGDTIDPGECSDLILTLAWLEAAPRQKWFENQTRA